MFWHNIITAEQITQLVKVNFMIPKHKSIWKYPNFQKYLLQKPFNTAGKKISVCNAISETEVKIGIFYANSTNRPQDKYGCSRIKIEKFITEC